MPMTKRVQCFRAGDYRYCEGCDHTVPHERQHVHLSDDQWCTEWETCTIPGQASPKVRCVEVKK